MIQILKDADVSFANLETAIHDFEGYPLGEGKGDAYGQADPNIAEELKSLGLKFLSRANNHSMDYSLGGLLATSQNLDRVGLRYAGAGIDLADARKPSYFRTSKGVVSFISATTFNLATASYPRKNLQGRPGVNPLRVETNHYLESGEFNAFKEILKKLKMWTSEETEQVEEFTFPPRQNSFKLSEETKTEYSLNENDRKWNLKSITDAKRLSDYVLFTLHDHYASLESIEGYEKRHFATEPIEKFARECIDTGADIFTSHGTHVLRGVEIYKEKPIFYGLGNFVFQSTLISKQPSDLFERYGLGIEDSTADLYEKREEPPRHFFDKSEYWESILANMTFKDHKLIDLKLYPLTLDYDTEKPLRKQRTKAGVPRLAQGEKAKKIINDLRKISAKYKTEITLENDIGIVKL
jgi:poly-gamma-glutamate synthesis protein (capsule biosynthesis protein)